MKKSTWIILIVVVIVACCCMALVAAAATGGFVLFRKASTELNTPPAPVMEQIAEIETQVSGIRGLVPTNDLPRGFLSPDELRQKVETDFFTDYTAEEAVDDVRELSLFGLLPQGFDLYQLYVDLYGEQIAGYYDPEVKEMYVVQDATFDGPERMTYAHEYTHVLQDQTYDLREGLKVNPDACETTTEYCAAVTALIEGDATLTEQMWFLQHSTLRDKKDVQEFYTNMSSPILDSAPKYVVEDLMFPYLKGLTFVQQLQEDGGWEAVDAAYQNPPVSTEQILHPDRYPQDAPIPVSLPDVAVALGSEWRLLDANVMGEWYTYLILSFGSVETARVDQKDAEKAAEGWGGDAYTTLWNDAANAGVSVLLSQWDTPADADEFWQTLGDYGQARWDAPDQSDAARMEWQETEQGSVLMLRSGEKTLWIIAPTPALASQVADLLTDF